MVYVDAKQLEKGLNWGEGGGGGGSFLTPFF